jgi:hypothetical protein
MLEIIPTESLIPSFVEHPMIKIDEKNGSYIFQHIVQVSIVIINNHVYHCVIK